MRPSGPSADNLVEQYFEGCGLYRHQPRGDDRGWLVALEENRDVPFDVARVYYLFGQGPDVERGFHAHRALNQWAVCVSGGCKVRLYDGHVWKTATLDSPDLGLQLGPMIWHEMFDFVPDTVFVVLASDHYDESDYIRDRPTFEALAWAAETP